jgi:hypothetical protein
MRKNVHSLCPDCDACPEVAIHDDGRVTIGEAPNLVTLNRKEWNQLVRLIRTGEVDEVRG